LEYLFWQRKNSSVSSDLEQPLAEFDMVLKVQNSQTATDKIECLFHLQERVHFTHD
jgi:hypothetical protein